ncbi:MAG: transposase [Rhodobacterales bacterium]
MDNLATRKNAVAEQAMRQTGCWFLFLPPYSVDLNRIEMAFSKHACAGLVRALSRTYSTQSLKSATDLHPKNVGTIFGCRI